MTKEEAIEAIKEAYGNSEYTDEIIKALEQEPCEDVVKKECDKCAYYDNGANDEACNGCFEDEEHLNFKPKPKTGHWIYIGNSEVNGLKIVKCSECGKRTYGSGKYCPNCGVKMIKIQESE